MARGGVEAAVWDLEARMLGLPLYKHIGGGARREIPCGVSIGIQESVPQLLQKIETELAAGYQRIKMKISPNWDVDVVREVRRRFPNTLVMADANSAYTLADAARLKCLDEFGLMMIEQPLAHDEIIDHAKLQAELKTPICLDECIRSAHHAGAGVSDQGRRIINIKLGRVGGFAEAKKVILVQAAGIPVWWRDAGIGDWARAQRGAGDASEFRVTGRRVGEQALLEARHHSSGGGKRRRAGPSRFGTRRASGTISIPTSSKLSPFGGKRVSDFLQLLKANRNYRYCWSGQVVSEIGDHFNNVAVFSLALANTRSGMVVTGVMLARAIPAVMAGPLAGVVLDRLDRKKIMIASDLVRAVVALGFILAIPRKDTWLLYILSALLMFASPFFTSGRSAILPTIASKEELHTANSLTQTTQWMTLTIGAFLGGTSVVQFGYDWAFAFNAMSFLFSAASIASLHLEGGSFKAQRQTGLTEAEAVRAVAHEYTEGLRYMKSPTS